MPYPNEHSCRLKNPADFDPDSFARIEKGEGTNKISIIIAKPKGKGTTEAQAYRYNKVVWDEDRARNHCQENDGTFEPAIKEGTKMIDIVAIDSLSKAYAAHNELHGAYADTKRGGRVKLYLQTDHEQVVRHILDLGGYHLSKGDALDDTLPQELREAFQMRYLSDSIILVEGATSSTIQILRTGTFYHPRYGKFAISNETLGAMVRNFNDARPKPPTEMVVDWEHMSASTPPQKSPAAGWVKSLTSEGDKLFALVEWTEEAIKEIKNKEYRFISPQFEFNYKDKETGKRIGPTLLSVALTNRPFIEGMEPVVLSEELGAMVFSEESIDERTNTVRRAFYAQFPAGVPESHDYISEVYDDYVIIDSGGVLFRVPYIKDETTGQITFDDAKKVMVTLVKTYEEVKKSMRSLKLKDWDTTYINDLPDSAFALIQSGGEKDEEGKTVPRTLRNLPYKDKSGKVDLPHLRNALSRLPQTDLTPDEQSKARAVLITAAKAAGVGEYSELPGVTVEEWESIKGKEDTMELELEVRQILALAEGADVVTGIRALKARADGADTKVIELTAQIAAAEKTAQDATVKLTEREVEDIIQKALKDGKLLPKQQIWAKDMCLNDRPRFMTYLETAEKVGPNLTIVGKEGEPPTAIQLTDMDRKVAAQLGVTDDKLLAAKVAAAKGVPGE